MIFIRRHITISFFSFLLSVFFVNAHFLYAQSVFLNTNKTSYEVGEGILVTVSLQTGGQPINTAEGQINFSPNLVSISDVRYGNSIISLWVKKPIIDNMLGTISFTGGVPGGFSGNSGTLFTFVIKPKKEGSVTISLKDVHILLNDGSGGELPGLKTLPLTLNISKAKTTTPKSIENPTEEKITIPKDTTPPENFVPMVSHHKSIADDAYFVAFSAVDKDSGVIKYEVREVPKIIGLMTDSFSTPWQEAVSPYVLSFQSWGSRVEVRAIDGAGNSTVVNTNKPFGMIPIIIFVSVLILVAIILTRFYMPRK